MVIYDTLEEFILNGMQSLQKVFDQSIILLYLHIKIHIVLSMLYLCRRSTVSNVTNV